MYGSWGAGLVAALSLAVFATGASANCYQLLDSDGETIYLDTTPPFSLSWPPETHPERELSRSNGEHLIIHSVATCTGLAQHMERERLREEMAERIRERNERLRERVEAEGPITVTAPRTQPVSSPSRPTTRIRLPDISLARTDPLIFCEQAQDYAIAVLRGRYANIPMSQAMRQARGVEVFEQIVIGAYDRGRYSHNEEVRERDIREYGNRIYSECLQGLR